MTTEARHTPEPWGQFGTTVCFPSREEHERMFLAKEFPITSIRVCQCENMVYVPKHEAEANAARIVAAVNFCRGTPTAALADGGLAEVREALEYTAKRILPSIFGTPESEAREWITKVNAAIARLKGE